MAFGFAVLLAAQQLAVGDLRDALLARYGQASFGLAIGAGCLTGLALIVAGYSGAEYQHLWLHPAWHQIFLLPLIFLACVFAAAEVLPSNLKRFAPHPLAWACVCWALGHLAVRGDSAAVFLFGGFGLLGVIEIVTPNRRARREPAPRPWSRESLVVGVGGILFMVFLLLHQDLFGSSPTMLRPSLF